MQSNTQISGNRSTLCPLIAVAAVVGLTGCSGVEKAPPQPRFTELDSSLRVQTPRVLRGTIGAETTLVNFRPVIVNGYGLMVGLNGTGSRQMLPAVRQMLIEEASKQGFGLHTQGYGAISPEELLDSPNTAVVMVQGLVPPGATKGTTFDVRIMADPYGDTTSLEGGTLYTTQLRPGGAMAGTKQTFAIAEARGDIFINPFAEPDATNQDAINRLSGRILNGGIVTEEIPVRLLLNNPGHARAEIIQNSINARFPVEPGQRNKTAHGRSDEAIDVTIPPSYRDETEEFIQILRHTTIRQGSVDSVATSLRRILEREPSQYDYVAWRWRALGRRVIPIVKDMYDYPEELPRLAALRTGAALDDSQVIPYLIELAHSTRESSRREAIELMSGLSPNPLVEQAYEQLLSDPVIDIRVAAYEAMAKRGSRGVKRKDIDGKFLLDIVESEYPMIYITQRGQPRIALFGQDLQLEEPLSMSAWSNRLMMVSDLDTSELMLRYVDLNGSAPATHEVSPDLPELIFFLAHEKTVESPSPGLALTYSETVGAIHQIWRQNYVKADFKAEQDLILAAILEQQETTAILDRPESPGAVERDESTESPDPMLPGNNVRSDLQVLDPLANEDNRFLTKPKPETPPQ